jgi:hypothetical protein
MLWSIGWEHWLDLTELVADVGIDKIMELLTNWVIVKFMYKVPPPQSCIIRCLIIYDNVFRAVNVAGTAKHSH